MLIGGKIKYLRKRNNLTQVELAQLSSVRQSAISDLENGKRKRIDYQTLRGITSAFGMTIEEFEALEPEDSQEKVKKLG